MLLAEQPTHVGEEEATTRVVGIGVCVGKLVMHTMIACPLPDAVLEGERLAQHEENAQRQLCLVRLVRPQTMHARRDTQTPQEAKDID